MNAMVVASDPDEPTTTIQASHCPGMVQFGLLRKARMEIITVAMSFLATSAVRGSPKIETKLPGELITIRGEHPS